MRAIISLEKNLNKKKIVVENQYSRVVSREGNPVALEKMHEVFEPCDAIWRGIGSISGSGLRIRDEYGDFDAWNIFGTCADSPPSEPAGCLCGEVLKGKKTPKECKLFGALCTPENPAGACMVSSEGTCAAFYRYGGT
jgi:hydrogenase expression/formation protein HypD